MPELPQALSPAALAALLQKVDEVCAQAQSLRAEIVNAMQRHRADDRNIRPRESAPNQKPSARKRPKG
jgi:hypothetical protein